MHIQTIIAAVVLGSAVATTPQPATAATPDKPQPEPIVIRVDAIDPESVTVYTRRRESAGHLSFTFRSKSSRDAWRLLRGSGSRRARITDGATVLAEAGLAGIVQDQTKKTGGLILSFESIEEAHRVAAAIRPFLK